MKLSKAVKILVGLGTAWPLVYFVIFFIFVFSSIARLATLNQSPGSEFPVIFIVLIVAHLITIVVYIAIEVFYIIHIIKHQSLSEGFKIMWMILLVFMGFLAMPVYWFLCVWPEPKEEIADIASSNTQ